MLRPSKSVLRSSRLPIRRACCARLRAKRGVIHSSRKGNVNALAFGENDEAGCRDQVAMLPKQEAFASKISAEIEESGARSTTP